MSNNCYIITEQPSLNDRCLQKIEIAKEDYECCCYYCNCICYQGILYYTFNIAQKNFELLDKKEINSKKYEKGQVPEQKCGIASVLCITCDIPPALLCLSCYFPLKTYHYCSNPSIIEI